MNSIEVHNLSKQFKQAKRESGIRGMIRHLFKPQHRLITAVKSISFTIPEGQFVGFLGPNGAGKTTTLKMLAGILYPTSGSASVLGYTPWKREKAFQKKFSLVMGQKNQLWWDLPVIESFEFNRTVYEIPRDIYESQKKKLISLLAIENLMDVQARKLSLGQRMKCELAACLLHRPQILFLDEPTIGLDVVSQKNIRTFLSEYNRTNKATILLTSHYMEDIRRLCERVIIIDHGSIIYDGDYVSLIERFADTKTIEVTFRESVAPAALNGYGKITEYRETSCSFIVARDHVTETTTRLLKNLPVEDISIHEEPMEEVVSALFTRQTSR